MILAGDSDHTFNRYYGVVHQRLKAQYGSIVLAEEEQGQRKTKRKREKKKKKKKAKGGGKRY